MGCPSADKRSPPHVLVAVGANATERFIFSRIPLTLLRRRAPNNVLSVFTAPRVATREDARVAPAELRLLPRRDASGRSGAFRERLLASGNVRYDTRRPSPMDPRKLLRLHNFHGELILRNYVEWKLHNRTVTPTLVSLCYVSGMC